MPSGKYFLHLSRKADHTPWMTIAAVGRLLAKLGLSSTVEELDGDLCLVFTL